MNDDQARKAISRIRSSAHDLRVETGRYASHRKLPSLIDRTCRFCCLKCAKDNMILLADLPHFEPIIESEVHAITECPGYHHLRINLTDNLKCHLLLGQYPFIMAHLSLAKELGSFLIKCFNLRNPKKPT